MKISLTVLGLMMALAGCDTDVGGGQDIFLSSIADERICSDYYFSNHDNYNIDEVKEGMEIWYAVRHYYDDMRSTDTPCAQREMKEVTLIASCRFPTDPRRAPEEVMYDLRNPYQPYGERYPYRPLEIEEWGFVTCFFYIPLEDSWIHEGKKMYEGEKYIAAYTQLMEYWEERCQEGIGEFTAFNEENWE